MNTRWFSLLLVLLTAASLSAADTVGWRGDGSGRFENARPPIQWDKGSENILWSVEVGNGYSSPVAYRDRLFITGQPSEVICLDPKSGAEIWRATAGYIEALGEDRANEIAARQKKLNEERSIANRAYDELRKADPDSPKLEELKQARQEVDQRRREFEREYPPEERGGAGNAAATIVCGGDHVFALFGTGIMAAFDIDGKRQWIRRLETPEQGFGHSASPVIAAGKLIVHIDTMLALDPTAGTTVWQADVPAKFGSPVTARVDGTDLVVTPSGYIVNATNGKILAEKQFQLSNNSPIVHEGVIYAHEGGNVKALHLPSSLEEPFELDLLWESTGTRDQRMASAVYHNGLLYAAGRKGIIDVLDAATGNSIYKKRLDIGEVFASPTLAGEYIFYPGRDGKTLVLRPGDKYDEVATNSNERVSSTPLFDGRRMYLRTGKKLICIGEK